MQSSARHNESRIHNAGSDLVVADSQPAPRIPAVSPTGVERPAEPALKDEECGPSAQERDLSINGKDVTHRLHLIT